MKFEKWLESKGYNTNKLASGVYACPKVRDLAEVYELACPDGFVVVPVEMSWQKADELAMVEWDKNKNLFCYEHRDLTAFQVNEYRLRWCKNKAYQIMENYKAMIGAVDEIT